MGKIIRALSATILFGALLVCAYRIHITYFTVDVVFYAAIADVVIATMIMMVFLSVARYFDALSVFEKSQLILIWLLTGYALAISVPTVIDRSLSFYILEKLRQRGGGIRQDAFERVFTREYMSEHRLVDVRLTEQLESGTIVIEDGCVLLTPKGRAISGFSRYFRRHWLPKKRLLMGSYTDALTDPFRRSPDRGDYECKRSDG